MAESVERSYHWQGRSLLVDVLHSRAGVAQHILIGNGRANILVDAGDGVLRDLLAAGYPPGKLAGIFITHGHYDHMGGLHSLLGFMRMIGRRDDFPVLLPTGCSEALTAIKTFQSCYPDSVPFVIEPTELEPGQTVTVSGMSVRAFGVSHCGSISGSEVLDAIPAMGYRISCDGETVAVTGDTGKCDSLDELVSGADLAVIEATFESSDGKPREVLENVHLSEDLAHEIGRLAKKYVLVHKGSRL